MIRHRPLSSAGFRCRLLWLLILVGWGAAADSAGDPPEIPEFHQAVDAALTPEPWSLGPPLEDRPAWTALAGLPQLEKTLTTARTLARQTFSMPDDSRYTALAADADNVYNDYEAGITKLRAQLNTLFLAYAITERPEYLAGTTEILRLFCQLRSWTKPSADRDLGNFNGTAPTIDLRSSRLAWQLAIIRQKLGNRLPADLNARLKAELERRIVAIYRDTIRHQVRYTYTLQNDNAYWLNARHNWNAVCLSGVIGVVLATVEDAGERRALIARALDYSENYLRGYPPDGYCSEGPGYWTYGFKHYMLTARMLEDATGGRLKMMRRPEVAAAAFYPDRIRLTNGFFPALADCTYGTSVNASLLATRDSFFDRPTAGKRRLNVDKPKELPEFLASMHFRDFPRATMPERPPELPPMTLFPNGGVAVLRPASGDRTRLAALFKGGSNHEVHNHNDVGSFLLLLDGRPMVIDPGSEIYSGRTFGGKRYESRVLNSFGHAVPRLGERLQSAGPDTDARTVARQTAPDAPFRWTLDLGAAYQLKAPDVLERTFVYRRDGEGEVSVSDRLRLRQPTPYEFAIITQADWRQTAPDRLELETDGKILEAVFTSPVACRITTERLNEKQANNLNPLRIAIATVKPVAELDFRVVFRPKALRP